MWSWVFCSDSNQSDIGEYTGHMQHNSSINFFHHHRWDCLVSGRDLTDSALWWVVELFPYILQNNYHRNEVYNKCNALQSSPHCLNSPGLWNNCLSWNWSLMPKMLRSAGLLAHFWVYLGGHRNVTLGTISYSWSLILCFPDCLLTALK